MTNDEALKILPDMKGAGDDWDKAIDLAIEALNNSNTLKSLDCVDRQAVKEMMCVKHCTAYPTCQQKYGCYKTHDLELLPLVQPVDKDINVSCKDAISRQDAIDAVDKLSDKPIGYLESAIDVLVDLPSVQPEPHWIPVTERLPEKPNMYTVTDSKGDVVRFIYTATKSSREYWKRCAKAWMPLPEPYKENEYEEKNNKTN